MQEARAASVCGTSCCRFVCGCCHDCCPVFRRRLRRAGPGQTLARASEADGSAAWLTEFQTWETFRQVRPPGSRSVARFPKRPPGHSAQPEEILNDGNRLDRPPLRPDGRHRGGGAAVRLRRRRRQQLRPVAGERGATPPTARRCRCTATSVDGATQTRELARHRGRGGCRARAQGTSVSPDATASVSVACPNGGTIAWTVTGTTTPPCWATAGSTRADLLASPTPPAAPPTPILRCSTARSRSRSPRGHRPGRDPQHDQPEAHHGHRRDLHAQQRHPRAAQR